MDSTPDGHEGHDGHESHEEQPFLSLINGDRAVRQKTSWFVIRLACTVSLGGFLFGYDTGIISGAILLIKKDFDLTSLQQEWVIASATAGAMVGAFGGGYLNDRIGRKPATLLAALLFIGSSLFMGLAPSFALLLIGRIIAGMGVGLASMTVPLYIAEVSPPEYRGALVSSNILFVTGGQFISYLVAAGLSLVDGGWRYMLGLGAIPPTIQIIGMIFLPESPRFLVKKGSIPEALEVLKKIGCSNSEDQIEEIQTALKRVGTWRELFTNHRKQLIIGSILLGLQQFCGINTAMYYSATILKMAGFQSDTLAIIFSCAVAFANMIFTLVGMYLIDKKGRRTMLLSTLPGCALGLTLLGVAFYLILGFEKSQAECALYESCAACVIDLHCGFCQNNVTSVASSCFPANAEGLPDLGLTCSGDWLYEGGCQDSTSGGILALTALVFYVACFAVAMGPIPWAVMSEIFPLSVRGKASGIAGASNWTANLIVSATLLTLFHSITQAGTFWLYSGFCVLSWLFVFFFLPETKGTSLEGMETVFVGGH